LPFRSGVRGRTGNQLCQALGAELALRSKDRCSGIGEKMRVDRLVVVHRVRKGNQDARDTCDRDLSDRGRSGAAHDEVRLGIGRSHVLDKAAVAAWTPAAEYACRRDSTCCAPD